MVELVRSNDPVQLSLIMAMLEAALIDAVLFDLHSSVIEGSIGAIPQRIMVLRDDIDRARLVLAEAQAR